MAAPGRRKSPAWCDDQLDPPCDLRWWAKATNARGTQDRRHAVLSFPRKCCEGFLRIPMVTLGSIRTPRGAICWRRWTQRTGSTWCERLVRLAEERRSSTRSRLRFSRCLSRFSVVLRNCLCPGGGEEGTSTCGCFAPLSFNSQLWTPITTAGCSRGSATLGTEAR